MNALRRLAATVLWLSAAAGVGLAFLWPFAISPDPAGAAFRVAGIATLVAFLAALAVTVAFKAASLARAAGREG